MDNLLKDHRYPPPPKMSYVVDSMADRGKVFKTFDLVLNSVNWRALARGVSGEKCCQIAVKNLRPELRSSLETDAVFDGALSRYHCTDWGACL